MSKRELIDTGTDRRHVRRDNRAGSRRASMFRDRSPPIGVTMRNKRPNQGRATWVTARTETCWPLIQDARIMRDFAPLKVRLVRQVFSRS